MPYSNFRQVIVKKCSWSSTTRIMASRMTMLPTLSSLENLCLTPLVRYGTTKVPWPHSLPMQQEPSHSTWIRLENSMCLGAPSLSVLFPLVTQSAHAGDHRILVLEPHRRRHLHRRLHHHSRALNQKYPLLLTNLNLFPRRRLWEKRCS